VSAVRYGSPAARLLLQVAGGAAQAEVVVTLHGELDVVDAASVMAVLAAAAARNPRIIVDLAALEFIDCRALGALGRVRGAGPAGRR
jgi:anti-anti-sigma factor